MTAIDLFPSMRRLGARLAPFAALRPGGRAGAAPSRTEEPSVPPLRPRIDIALRHPAPETQERLAHRDRGLHLARQEAWDRLSEEMHQAETARALTSGGTPVAALLSRGARQDAVEAARDQILAGNPAGAFAALEALAEDLREDFPEDSAIKHVIASAYLDLARICATVRAPDTLAKEMHLARERLIAIALEHVDHFDPFGCESPLWAAMRCAVLPFDPAPGARVADDYDDLIELDPGCPGHLRAMGRDMLPARFGSYTMLHDQALRAMHQTADVWGRGAYTFALMGAIEMDAAVLDHVDGGLFAEGMHDILTLRPDPHFANSFAAFTGVVVPASGIDTPATQRIRGCFDWIIADYLTELHPLVWAEARAPGHPPRRDGDPVRRGRNRAEQAISQRLGGFLQPNERIVFGADGMQIATI